MKKSYLLLGLLVALILLAMTACSSEDDSAKNILNPGDYIYFQYIEADVPYSPIEISEMPQWLQSRISNPLIGANRMAVYVGSLDSEVYYNIEPETFADSYYNPKFRDINGNLLDKNQGARLASKITNWKCIYYIEL
jgi:hypothetical protein